jgi:hypothetical protein
VFWKRIGRKRCSSLSGWSAIWRDGGPPNGAGRKCRRGLLDLPVSRRDRPSLRRERLGRPAAHDGHVDVFAGEGVDEGLAYRTESYNRIAHNASPIGVDVDFPAFNGAGLSVPLCGEP